MHTVGQDDWTTLPDLNGSTDSVVPSECEAGFPLAGHPCAATGTSGSWNRFTGNSGGWQPVAFDLSAYAGRQVEVSVSYVTDPGSGGGRRDQEDHEAADRLTS
ncbi:hypothetical protein LDL08_10280 [Nonomuraea glycinis]|uniref:Uncharacterized protein n=1 Tax=Nonomuraea glycinis TaxID=2047744 RepID=A0A918A5G7_9ACTN|nr:hypothetical protein [Nonomuraea glycinis]MCA2176570.1 hypothetical protein [Nonomuraea glycinis]GGP06897.1 hypothetical protein GCM10012278_32500 [Nonomuraea glycinis]